MSYVDVRIGDRQPPVALAAGVAALKNTTKAIDLKANMPESLRLKASGTVRFT